MPFCPQLSSAYPISHQANAMWQSGADRSQLKATCRVRTKCLSMRNPTALYTVCISPRHLPISPLILSTSSTDLWVSMVYHPHESRDVGSLPKVHGQILSSTQLCNGLYTFLKPWSLWPPQVHVSLNSINCRGVPPNPRWFLWHSFFGFLLNAYIVHGFQVPHYTSSTRPALTFTSHFLLFPQCVNHCIKLIICYFYNATLFSSDLGSRQGFMLIHAYRIQVRRPSPSPSPSLGFHHSSHSVKWGARNIFSFSFLFIPTKGFAH